MSQAKVDIEVPGIVGVVGLAKSGRSAARLLSERGWRVIASDRAPIDAPELVEAGVTVNAPSEDPFAAVELLIRSPGVPEQSPVLRKRRGLPIRRTDRLIVRQEEGPGFGIVVDGRHLLEGGPSLRPPSLDNRGR